MVKLIKDLISAIVDLKLSINNLNDSLHTIQIQDKKILDATLEISNTDTSDIFRIKEGPKKGLLSYKKARV